MTLKNLGRSKKFKKIKCPKCGTNNDIIPEEVEEIQKVRYIYCRVCGEEIIIKE